MGCTERTADRTQMDCISNLDKDATWPPMAPSSLPYPLTSIEYQRYGRQLVLPAFGGVQSQLRLRNAKALVVGAGGLGCPAVQYLASAGVGAITVVDHDNVERSNLARQVLHTEDRIGMAKVQSIREAVKSLNPHVRVIPVHEPFTSLNATDLVAQHDLVLDCTDNPLTRYLINDAAVLADKMVVSGAAQGTEGQLMVLHKHLPTLDPSDSPQRGPCYRCLFPIAPNPQDVTACEDGGVLGTITGILGTMQANEAIKLLTGMIAEEELSEVEAISASRNRTAPEITDPKDTTTTTTTSSSPPCQSTLAVPVRMLLASPMSLIPFRSIKLRPRAPNCRACGDESVLAEQNLRRISDLGQEDYHTFCGLPPTEEAQEEGEDITLHMTVKDLASMTQSGGPWLILDVRTSEEYHIVKLPRTLREFRGRL